MSMHSPIHLIRQVELRAPLALLRAHAAPVGEILVRSGLPERLQEPGSGFVPARRLLDFLRGGALTLEMEDFTFRAVLQAPDSQVGSWGERIGRCWRLRDALHSLCLQIPEDAPFDELGLSYADDYAWLWRRRHLPPKNPHAERQGEQYVFAAMLRAVRTAAGLSWTPPAVRAESADSDWLLRTDAFSESAAHFGGDVIAIAVPYDLLDLRLPRATPTDPVPAGEELPAAATDLAGSLQQALTPLLGVEHLSLDLAAEIAETSARSLRRWLQEERTSFRAVLERILFEAAEERLREPTLWIADISAELGYANEANFTRAFKRWTGEAPNAYRRRRCLH
jgi:AraC-like DNA-binding protein